MRRLLVVVLALCSMVLVGPAVTLAQDATPVAEIGEVLDPSECTAEAPSADELVALWFPTNAAGTPTAATPVAGNAMSGATVPAPLGEPADAETVAAVTASIRQVLACFSGGSFLRAYAYFSENLQRQFGPEPEDTLEDVRAFLELPEEPVPQDQRVRLIAITDVSVMDDGRVGAILVSDDPEGPPEGIETELIIFIQEDGLWLVDEVIEFTVVEDDED
jgi:hypothetical protein